MDRRRGGATKRGYGSAWQRLAREVIAAHRSFYGDWCPGYRVPAHPSADLTVDHVVSKALGGTDTRENTQVLCRSCNSRKHSSSA